MMVYRQIRILYVAILPVIWHRAAAIDCFDCFSFNNSDPSCGDPFHPAYGDFKKDCAQGRDGRIGLFPAKYCIKLNGNAAQDNIAMFYRGCSLESLDSQCGEFRFEGVRYRGCVMSCTENGCNNTSGLMADIFTVTILTFVLLVIVKMQYTFC